MANDWDSGLFRAWLADELDEREWRPMDLARRVQPDNPQSMASSISKWSRGIRQPDPASLERLAFVLGADPDYVLALGGHRRVSDAAPLSDRERRTADLAAMIRDLPQSDLAPVEVLVRGLHDAAVKREADMIAAAPIAPSRSSKSPS